MRRLTIALLVGLLLVGLLLAAGCSSGAEDTAAVESAAAPEADLSGEGIASRDAADGDGEAAEAQPGDADGEPALPASDPASTGERIIKEGTVSVEVDEGRFDAAFGRVVAAATNLGGTVVSSTTSTADSGATSGTVTVRVPVERYEELLVGVGDIGRVVARQVSAQDVTDEFTDLESRLRHLRAQERFYLGLLEEASSVADAITVQSQLDDVQARTEQVQGRLQLLDARTAFSTLTIELYEPGTSLELAGVEGARPDLGGYWVSARDAFVNVVGSMLVVVFFLAPLLLPAAVVLAAWRLLRRRPATVAAPPE